MGLNRATPPLEFNPLLSNSVGTKHPKQSGEAFGFQIPAAPCPPEGFSPTLGAPGHGDQRRSQADTGRDGVNEGIC